MKTKQRKPGKFVEELKKDLEKCELCNKKGKIKHAGGLFCSEEHVRLYGKKWEEAEKRMNTIKKCSVCGKPVGDSNWTIIDCRIKDIKDSFTPHRFCSEECFEKW